MPYRDEEEPDDDGWIRVRRGKGASAVHLDVGGVSRSDKDATVEKLQTDFERKTKLWLGSSCRKEVRQILARVKPDDGWSLKKAVCLATGSFSRDDWECAKRSMLQLVVFVDIVRHLQASSDSIRLLAQEPEYTALDKEFLAILDVSVLDMQWEERRVEGLQRAKDHLGPETVVFEFFMDMGPPSLRTLLASDSKLYIGSSCQGRLDRSSWERYRGLASGDRQMEQKNKADLEEDARVVEHFYENHDSCRFPRFEEDPNVFRGIAFHWKTPRDDDGNT